MKRPGAWIVAGLLLVNGAYAIWGATDLWERLREANKRDVAAIARTPTPSDEERAWIEENKKEELITGRAYFAVFTIIALCALAAVFGLLTARTWGYAFALLYVGVGAAYSLFELAISLPTVPQEFIYSKQWSGLAWVLAKGLFFYGFLCWCLLRPSVQLEFDQTVTRNRLMRWLGGIFRAPEDRANPKSSTPRRSIGVTILSLTFLLFGAFYGIRVGIGAITTWVVYGLVPVAIGLMTLKRQCKIYPLLMLYILFVLLSAFFLMCLNGASLLVARVNNESAAQLVQIILVCAVGFSWSGLMFWYFSRPSVKAEFQSIPR